MPIFPVNPGGPQLPLEGSPYPAVSAWREEVGNAQSRTLGMTMIQDATRWAEEPFVPQTWVSHDDAVQALQKQGYDTSGVPDNGLNGGVLLERMNRASKARQTADDVQRANLGFVGRTSAELTGGLGDPLNIVLAPIGGYGVTAIRAGLGARVALGAAEGAAFAGGNAEASAAYSKAHNLGDPDLTSGDLVRTMLTGAAFGGILNGAFGPRAVAGPGGGPVTLEMIDTLGERTGAYASAHGVPVNEVVSNKGAVGRYQIEPITGRTYGLLGTDTQIREQLKDPFTNERIAKTYLDDLNKRFPNDPQAVAIAWNAGPSVAKRFIRSGRDWRVVPEESRAYAARIAGMPMSVRASAAETAMDQATKDQPVDVQPTVDAASRDVFKTNPFKLADEHAAEVSGIETEAFQNAAKPKSTIGDDDALAHIDQTSAQKPVTTEQPAAEAAIDPELQQHVANAEQDAKAVAANLGDERLAYEEPEPLVIDGMTADEHQKAVEAAVHCGLTKGTL